LLASFLDYPTAMQAVRAYGDALRAAPRRAEGVSGGAAELRIVRSDS